jgi:hypothetical protein
LQGRTPQKALPRQPQTKITHSVHLRVYNTLRYIPSTEVMNNTGTHCYLQLNIIKSIQTYRVSYSIHWDPTKTVQHSGMFHEIQTKAVRAQTERRLLEVVARPRVQVRCSEELPV